jgi:hypothetical protein
MAREWLTIEEHKAAAGQIYAMFQAQSKLLEIINGKVPVKILDQLLSFRGVDKAVNRLRSDLEDEMFRRHRHPEANLEVYYGSTTTVRLSREPIRK